MRIKRFFDIHHSLVTRVVFFAVATSLTVYVATFGTALFFAEEDMTEQADDKVNLCLDIAVSSVDDEMKGVEDAVSNAVEYLISYSTPFYNTLGEF